jgi:NAD-dependent deacetylase
MAKIIDPGRDETHLSEAVAVLQSARRVAALSGAGISVESGIPDFRSPGGLWTVFSPEEYATLDVFLRDPAKAWKLYRELGRTILGKRPNPAHDALARMERDIPLEMVVTQNVDGLHQAAGSTRVVEIHGDHQHLQCLDCGRLEEALPGHLDEEGGHPRCADCGAALKPNVVLFGENVRGMDTLVPVLEECDALLVVGTSAQVYPAAGLPAVVQARGGTILEFNLEETALTRGGTANFFRGGFGPGARSDYFFRGKASVSLTMLADALVDFDGVD